MAFFFLAEHPICSEAPSGVKGNAVTPGKYVKPPTWPATAANLAVIVVGGDTVDEATPVAHARADSGNGCIAYVHAKFLVV